MYQDQQPASSAIQDVVYEYMDRGIAPIPVSTRSKNPNRKNWESERWTKDDVTRLWSSDQNVGVLCGEPSGWLVDVDCDCPEAVRLAPKFLPRTLKGGRDTAPGSHWWYRAEGCETKPFFGTTRKRILELRSNGCQTLVYPSVHPDDGDTYQWYRDLSDKMTNVDGKELRHKVNLLFTATIIARHMPPVGGRHDYALALAGFLQRNDRLTEDDASRVMVEAWSLFEDAGPDALRDVENSIQTTKERLNRKQPVVGGGALAVFEEGLVKALSRGWDWRVGTEEDQSYSWEDPEGLPEGLPPVPEFDLRMLPDAFRAWVEDVAERMQVPADFIAAPMMVALSAVVGRKVGIRPKRKDDWTVVPNLWGAIVGRPGLLKSPALKGALAPLDKLIGEAGKRHEERTREHETDMELHKAQLVWYEDEKKKLAKKGDMDAVKEFIGENHVGDEPEPPSERRYRTSDTTVEKLGELLNQNPNGLMVYRDELTGWLRGLDRYGRESDRAFYLEGWSGDQGHDVDRIGRGSLKVPALTLAILGGIQPGPLSSYVFDAGTDRADDDGLLPRFQMLVWPDPSPEFKNVDRYPDRKAKADAFDVFDFADRVNFDADADEVDGVAYLRFSEEAQHLFDTWRVDLEHELRSGNLSPAMESHKSKYRSLFPALALLLEIADSAESGEVEDPETGEVLRAVIGEPPTEVSEVSAFRAGAWCEFLEAHARRVYYSAERPEIRSARELLKHVKAGDVSHGEPVRSMLRKGWATLGTREEVDGALDVLQEHNWLRVLKMDTGGRPSAVVTLHPSLRPGR